MTAAKRPNSDSEAESSEENKKAKKTSIKVKWTAEEEAVFAEIANKILKAEMWKAVKEDKRLAHRKANGIALRVDIMGKRMAK